MNVSGVMLPPEWLPTISTGAVLGDVAQVPDLATEPEACDQPEEGQLLAEVVGVAVVEIRGQAVADLARNAARRSPWFASCPASTMAPASLRPARSELARRRGPVRR